MYSGETKIYIALLTGLIVLMVLVAFFVVTIVRYQRKKVSFYQEKIKAEFNYLEKERERIASDLHDGLGASLSAIKLNLQCLVGLQDQNAELVAHSELQIDQVMQNMRRISYNMMPALLQRKGLDEALKELIYLMTASTDIKVDYQYQIDDFEQGRAIHIYRIAQEILNNIVKHAHATRILFHVSKIKDKLGLHIQDNGVGFDKSKVQKKAAGMGLQNITSRTDLLGATVYLTTGPGKGADYFIEIPVS